MSVSSKALKIIENVSDLRLSFEKLHVLQKRATPTRMMKYRLALQLHKLYNAENFTDDWIDLNFQQNFNSRNNKVKLIDQSRLRIGKNLITNRLVCLNNEIDYGWLNLSFITYKICFKDKLLNWSWLKPNLTNHQLWMYFLKVKFFYTEIKKELFLKT